MADALLFTHTLLQGQNLRLLLPFLNILYIYIFLFFLFFLFSILLLPLNKSLKQKCPPAFSKQTQNTTTTNQQAVKPYTRFQKSHGHTQKWPTLVASLMLIACLVDEIIQPGVLFAYADPL